LTFLLDTNICIYALKRRSPAILERLREAGPDEVALSVITVLELRQGAERGSKLEQAHGRIDLFVAPMQVFPFGEEDARIAARIRMELSAKGEKIGDLDSLIAAQALARDLTLVTNNLREFERVTGLKVENWVAPGPA
jgi:tRNA(fMet)-specific endonuclease VapC